MAVEVCGEDGKGETRALMVMLLCFHQQIMHSRPVETVKNLITIKPNPPDCLIISVSFVRGKVQRTQNLDELTLLMAQQGEQDCGYTAGSLAPGECSLP